MRPQRSQPITVVAGVLVAVTVGVVIGRATGTQAAARPAVITVGGIALQTADTRAAALAAADNDLAIASQTVEQNPALFARLVDLAYAPGIRARTLSQAEALRRLDAADMANYAAGGRAVAVVAARRLDAFDRRRAEVTTWLGGFVWGPGLAPRQSWNLVDTTLEFKHGRWLVMSSVAERTPAPVPSIVYVEDANNRSPVFDRRLAGMSAPFYGTG